jgi:hypothetical protein
MYGHQQGNDAGDDQGGNTYLFAGEAEALMGNVCQRERSGDRRARCHQDN